MTTATFTPRVTMPPIRGMKEFVGMIEGSTDRLVSGLLELLRETKNRWVFEAKKRAPIDTGLLIDSINGEVFQLANELFVVVGSDVPYAVYVEFGTRRIAGGAVYALGLSPEITDAEAIKTWPAKEERGGGPDQMPWLRPSWWAIEPWFIQQLQLVMLGALLGGGR